MNITFNSFPIFIRKWVIPLLLSQCIFQAGIAENYPTRPIKINIPSPPGGGTDTLARILADKLKDRLGQPILIENRAGAGGNIAGEATFKAPPDGYTLMLAHPAPLVINKYLYQKLSYDPDLFTPIILVATVPNVLVVNSNGRFNSVQQLIASAKSNPDKFNYASGVIGSPSSLTPELFKFLTSTKITGIPFQGSSPAIVALLSGEVDLMFVELSTALPHIKSGKLKALAIANDKRSSFLADTPTLAETLPGFSAAVWFAIVGPPKLPVSISETLTNTLNDILHLPEVSKQISELTMESVGGSQSELSNYLKEESKRWSSVIKMGGFRVD
jgi:tripartite-type tricarboxylate transporter receptor subunit TctC